MRESEAQAVLAKLLTAFTDSEWGPEREATYVEHLIDLPAGPAVAAVTDMIETRVEKWMPTVAEIRQAIQAHDEPPAYRGFAGGRALPAAEGDSVDAHQALENIRRLREQLARVGQPDLNEGDDL